MTVSSLLLVSGDSPCTSDNDFEHEAALKGTGRDPAICKT